MSLDEQPPADGAAVPEGTEPRTVPETPMPTGGGADTAVVAPHRLRFLAFAVDACFVGVAVGLVAAVDLVLFFVILPLAYATYSGGLTWLTGGRTVGKALCGLVVRRLGPPVAPNARGLIWCVGRALALFFVDMLGLGTLTAFIDRRHRCLHDFVFGSEVVRIPEAELVATARERLADLDEAYGTARDEALRRAGVPTRIWHASTKVAGSYAAYVGWATLHGELPPGAGVAVRWAHTVADAATRAGKSVRDLLVGAGEAPVASLPAPSALSPAAIAGILVVTVPISIAAPIAIGEATRPDPLRLAGSWEITEYVETENVDVVPLDLVGTRLDVATVACRHTPCPVRLKVVEGGEDVEAFRGLRFEPLDGGAVYEARWESQGDCVESVAPHSVIASAAYDNASVLRWTRLDGGEDDRLSFTFEQVGTRNRELEDCPEQTSLGSEFVAMRRGSQ